LKEAFGYIECKTSLAHQKRSLFVRKYKLGSNSV
jgi:hypothetical protein